MATLILEIETTRFESLIEYLFNKRVKITIRENDKNQHVIADLLLQISLDSRNLDDTKERRKQIKEILLMSNEIINKS